MSAFERELMEQIVQAEFPAWATHAAVSMADGRVKPAAYWPEQKRWISVDPASVNSGSTVLGFSVLGWKMLLLQEGRLPTRTAVERAELAANKALHQILALCRSSENIGVRELRFFEIAMEGLEFPPAQRRREVEEAIQARRDRIAERQRAEGDQHAPT